LKSGSWLVGINKLIEVQDHATQLNEGALLIRGGRFAGEELLHGLGFLGRWLAAEGEVIGEVDLSLGIVAGFALEALGETLGLAVDEVAVEQGEGLRGDAGNGTPLGAVDRISSTAWAAAA
jgi:hypothetical protein